uniref:THAP-type domain-containing protein n=1 Tax=Acanthochromis polyacanthus TaxID=80966 RepID=A0A3Q1GT62_9TELE
MVISCVVVGCTKRFQKGSGLKFHRIPISGERRWCWLQAINRKNWTPVRSRDHVCGSHFSSGKLFNSLACLVCPTLCLFTKRY